MEIQVTYLYPYNGSWYRATDELVISNWYELAEQLTYIEADGSKVLKIKGGEEDFT